MARRRKSRPLWMTLPVWAMAIFLVAWGIWQAALFMGTLKAEAAPKPESAAAATVPGEIVQTAATENATTTGSDVIVDVAGDPWANAMTPATAEDDPAPQNLVALSAITSANAPASELLKQGAAFLDAGNFVEGRGALNAALVTLGEESPAPALRQQLTSLNEPIFLGSAIMPEDPAARLVEVQSGDSFLKLGQKYAIPAALLELINPGLNPRNLKLGNGVKIIQGPFHLHMFKAAHRLDLYARDLYVKSFAAEVEAGDYLPRGVYRVSSGTKIQVGKNAWIGFEGIDDSSRAVAIGWLYGDAGPRNAKGAVDRISGLKLRDADLAQLYNVLVETRSLLRVEP